MRSIRRSIQLPLVIAVPALALLVGVGASLLVAGKMRSDFDASLLIKAQALVSLTTVSLSKVDGSSVLDFDFADEAMPEFSRRSDPEYFELWDARGLTVERSRSLGTRDLPRLQTGQTSPVWRDYQLPDGRAGRLIEVAFSVTSSDAEQSDGAEPAVEVRGRPMLKPDSAKAVLVLAQTTDALNRLIVIIFAAFLGAAVALAAAMLMLIPRVLDRGLAALGDVAAQVGRIGVARLDARVVLAKPVQELAPVVTRINSLLTDLEAALARERRFSADAAHELRTPVAELKNLAEVGQRWPEDSAMAARFFADVGALAVQMEHIVNELFALARAEAGVDAVTAERVDLNALARSVWSVLQPAATSRQVRLHAALDAELMIVSDAAKLEIMLRNVLANAVQHSEASTEITLTTARTAGGWRLTVSNHAPQLEATDLPRLFERFWRKDASRSGAEHLGTGLALVRAIAQTLGIVATAELTAGHRLALSLEYCESSTAASPDKSG